jgi:hypothetical protein
MVYDAWCMAYKAWRIVVYLREVRVQETKNEVSNRQLVLELHRDTPECTHYTPCYSTSSYHFM